MSNNFDFQRAIELAHLVDAAYDQFDFATSKEKKVWPPDNLNTFKTDDGICSSF
ncbi:MAG: hypothetical protein NVS2B14_12930 [Chamaesiphon sp.]